MISIGNGSSYLSSQTLNQLARTEPNETPIPLHQFGHNIPSYTKKKKMVKDE